MDDMILYVENPREYTNNKIQKSGRIKKSTHKYLLYSYEQFEKEIKKTILFIIVSERIKYLGINLTKKVKNLYNESYKTQKEILKRHK